MFLLIEINVAVFVLLKKEICMFVCEPLLKRTKGRRRKKKGEICKADQIPFFFPSLDSWFFFPLPFSPCMHHRQRTCTRLLSARRTGCHCCAQQGNVSPSTIRVCFTWSAGGCGYSSRFFSNERKLRFFVFANTHTTHTHTHTHTHT